VIMLGRPQLGKNLLWKRLAVEITLILGRCSTNYKM